MDNEDRISGTLQENILVLLVFDDEACKLVRHAVDTPKLFESKIYREVAGVAIDFIDQQGVAIKEHIADEFEDIINGDDRAKAQSYERVIKGLYAQRERVNRDYVITKLHEFVRLQNIKSTLVRCVEEVENNNVAEVEVLFQRALAQTARSFEPGTDLLDGEQSLDFLDNPTPPLLTGIDVLDEHHIGPSAKTVFLVMAPLKRGKSWFLMHLGKWALLQGKTVVHITLEMSEAKTTARYMQTFFGITKRDREVRMPRIAKNRDGSMSDVFYDKVETLALDDPDIRTKLANLVRRRLSRRAPFRIKGFPSGSLTIEQLEAYLDSLERFHKIVPDVLILDYAELMAMTGSDKDKRNAIGQLFVRLRGLADRRNLAVITASQTNRGGIGKKVADETDLAEDISKGFTVDTIVTYNQTPDEYKLGLARLYVAAHRDDEGRQTALITQSYKNGQFCTDSVLLRPKYWEFIDRKGRNPDTPDDDDEEQRP